MNNNDILCPYCKIPLNDMITAILNHGGKPDRSTAVLCYECGEPLLYVEKGGTNFTLRKPTDDELIELQEKTSLPMARAAWVMAKERQDQARPPVIEETWGVYRRTVLRNEHDEDFVLGHKKAYYGGAIAMQAIFKRLSLNADEVEFHATMNLVDAELSSIAIEIPKEKRRE